MSKKVIVWTKEEIQDAFNEYLMEVNLIETDKWCKLSVDDVQTLNNRHFEIFFRGLKRWAKNRKVKEK